jgi:hypothetical protein
MIAYNNYAHVTAGARTYYSREGNTSEFMRVAST